MKRGIYRVFSANKSISILRPSEGPEGGSDGAVGFSPMWTAEDLRGPVLDA